jgi:cobalamin biosynthetic protein CobC
LFEHGGKLRAASGQFGIPLSDWVDLSTGIAPIPYPMPELPASVWQRLPEEEDGLLDAARGYYGAKNLLPVNGSQAAIMALPRLRAAGTVAVLFPGYGEYAPAWAAAGHGVIECTADEVLQKNADVIVLANPNNPDGQVFSREALLAAAERQAQRQGWLVVDEAFADVDSGHSLAAVAGTEAAKNVIVLRSLGKFFGLAGARVGFCIAAKDILNRLQDLLGPWPLANPARFAAKVGLGDTAWQINQRAYLCQASARLAALLRQYGLAPKGGTALFQYVPFQRGSEGLAALYTHFAQRGILVRRFTQPAALRFGLPDCEVAWTRLEAALRGAKMEKARDGKNP